MGDFMKRRRLRRLFEAEIPKSKVPGWVRDRLSEEATVRNVRLATVIREHLIADLDRTKPDD